MTFETRERIGLSRWWWTFVLRGALAIAFGAVAFLAPELGIGILVAAFAAWAIVDGIGSLVAGLRTRGQDRSWWLELLQGIVGIAAGGIALLLPAFAERELVLLIATWAIITGAIELVLAIRLRRVIRGEIWMELSGAASILFGILLLLFPATGPLSLVWLIGAFAVAFGVFLAMLGWRLRSFNRPAESA